MQGIVTALNSLITFLTSMIKGLVVISRELPQLAQSFLLEISYMPTIVVPFLTLFVFVGILFFIIDR